jgi:hypothetical protein
MAILASTCYLRVQKFRQQQTSAKWMSSVSLPHFFFLSLLTLSLISGTRNVVVHLLPTDKYVCAALLRQGLMPCAPYSPSAVITIRALKLFHSTHLRCPHVSVHSFVKTLCDIHADEQRAVLAQMSTHNSFFSVLRNRGISDTTDIRRG